MNEKFKGSLFLLLGTLIWGSAFVAQSLGMDHVGPVTFQAIRCLMAAVGLLPVIWLSDRAGGRREGFFRLFADKKLWTAAFGCALPLCFAINFQQVGILYAGAGKSAFLTAMYILFVPLLRLLMGKKVPVAVYPSLLLATMGLYFLSFYQMSGVSIGDVYLLLCAAAFAVQILFVDKFAPQVDPLRLNCLQALLCSLGSAAVMLLTEQPTLAGIRGSWWSMCYAGFLSMGAAYSLQILGQKRLDSGPASLIMSLESVFAVLFGWMFLKETMTGLQALGCCLVFAAVILSQLEFPRKVRK